MTDERRDLGFPDRRKNTYESLEKRLDEHVNDITCRLEKWLKRGIIAFAIIGVTSMLGLVGFSVNLGSIKDARKEFVRITCLDTNQRHDKTYEQLIALANADQARAPDEAAREEIRRRRDVTLALIDALAPKQDCTYLEKASVGDAKVHTTVKTVKTSTKER